MRCEGGQTAPEYGPIKVGVCHKIERTSRAANPYRVSERRLAKRNRPLADVVPLATHGQGTLSVFLREEDHEAPFGLLIGGMRARLLLVATTHGRRQLEWMPPEGPPRRANSRPAVRVARRPR